MTKPATKTEADLRRDRDRAAFAVDLCLTEMKWSGAHLSQLIRLSGGSTARLVELRSILGELGLVGHSRSWISTGGVFDHGTFWGRDGVPTTIVGHPYYYSVKFPSAFDGTLWTARTCSH